MARDPDTIERDIEQAREALASTLDQLADKTDPKRFIESGTVSVQRRLNDPRIKYPLMAVGLLLVIALVRRLFR